VQGASRRVSEWGVGSCARTPHVAAESTVTVAAGSGAKVRFALGRRAYALLRAHHKITLLINATITRSHSAPVRTSFTITVRLRK
jgi:hypothetical protein